MRPNPFANMTESKAQRWRALAIMSDGSEALLYLGSSIVQVRDNYAESWAEYFNDASRKATVKIVLQKWNGAVDCGRWETQQNSNLPMPKTAVALAG